MKNKLIIYSDIDETVNNLISYTLPIYNMTYDDNLKYEDIISYDIGKFTKITSKQYFKEFATNKNLSKLSLQSGCKKILDWINSQDWINFSFATAGYLGGLETRSEWLKDRFSWYDEDNEFIRIKHKQKLIGDLMFEDYFNNLENANYTGCIFTRPWNKDIVVSTFGINRFNKWDDEIIELIKDLAWHKGIKID